MFIVCHFDKIDEITSDDVKIENFRFRVVLILEAGTFRHSPRCRHGLPFHNGCWWYYWWYCRWTGAVRSTMKRCTVRHNRFVGCRSLVSISCRVYGITLMRNTLGFIRWKGNPESKVHGANMGPIWGRQVPGGSHIGPVNFVLWEDKVFHYNDVIMTTMASQITSLTVVYSIVYSGADQRKHQSSASLAFGRGSHRDRWIPRIKGQ